MLLCAIVVSINHAQGVKMDYTEYVYKRLQEIRGEIGPELPTSHDLDDMTIAKCEWCSKPFRFLEDNDEDFIVRHDLAFCNLECYQEHSEEELEHI
jgi:hypothetical protein